ncbi:hypothetical protein TcWFU_000521 [Taenia crassiceps]|uniref:Uncharacterized protein n=1 Tax=Taenia crassiceps TaxID=6207 RepID=A0ABR4QAD1_9CEST
MTKVYAAAHTSHNVNTKTSSVTTLGLGKTEGSTHRYPIEKSQKAAPQQAFSQTFSFKIKRIRSTRTQ